eukprot:2200203-Alexandrium_andersonii.AAC.1
MPGAYWGGTGHYRVGRTPESAGKQVADRTPREEACFAYCMWQMSRFYAFHDCDVIVLPDVEDKAEFPEGDWGR